jgi:3-oxoacyl-[acyl-carrier-protein] synthase-3
MPGQQHVGIIATGSYLPKQEVTIDDLTARFGVTAEWIERKTAIRTLRYAANDEAASDLATHAAVQALDQSGLTSDRLDYLIVSTSTGDHPVPPTSHLVQRELGAWNAACFDINVACSGFVYGLAIARGLLAVNCGRYALVVAGEAWSRFTDPADRSTALLLSDAGGAAVLGPVRDGHGLVATHLQSHGTHSSLAVVDAGGSRRPASAQSVEDNAHTLRMRGREVTEYVLSAVPRSVDALLAGTGIAIGDVDHFIPHQANGALLPRLTHHVGLTDAHLHMTVDRYGNSGSAGIPVTLDEANRAGRLRDGDLVLLAGFGSGMSIGSALLRWGGVGQ